MRVYEEHLREQAEARERDWAACWGGDLEAVEREGLRTLWCCFGWGFVAGVVVTVLVAIWIGVCR